MSQNKASRRVVISDVKITKSQVGQVLAKGKTHAKFFNKGVQKRLKKNQEKVRRAQTLRESLIKKMHKKTKVDEKITELVVAIATLFSRQNEGLDTRDMYNFLNFDRGERIAAAGIKIVEGGMEVNELEVESIIMEHSGPADAADDTKFALPG